MALEHELARRVFHCALAAWIAGTATFFFLRFSFAFYYANEAAIERLFDGFASPPPPG